MLGELGKKHMPAVRANDRKMENGDQNKRTTKHSFSGEENAEGLEAEERNHSMINAVDFRFCQHLFQSPECL